MLKGSEMQTSHERAPVTGETHDASTARLTGDVALLNRVRGEFREMPGMRLTIDQAMRLWGLDRVTVEGLFETLIAGRFLEVDGEGRYRMTHGGY